MAGTGDGTTGDFEDERVDLSGRWNDLEEELEDEEWKDEAPVDAENAIKSKEFCCANRARLAIAAQASERSLARRSTVSQGSSRDSNQSKKGRQLRQLPWPDWPLLYQSKLEQRANPLK